MKKQIIHIGGNKTGSTLLQRKLFPKLKDFTFLNFEENKSKALKEVIRSLIFQDDYEYNKHKLFLKNFTKNKNIIFSSEDIIAERFITIIAKRLKVCFPNGKVLFVIRNQITAFNSWFVSHGSYLKNVPKNYWKRYVDLKDWSDFCFNYPYQGPISALNYYKIFTIFSKIFGKSRIKVLLYEDLQENPNFFFDKLSHTLGIDNSFTEKMLSDKRERVSRTKLEYQLHSIFHNYDLSSTIYRFIKNFGIESKKGPFILTNSIEKRVIDYFSKLNHKLSKEININLKERGYP